MFLALLALLINNSVAWAEDHSSPNLTGAVGVVQPESSTHAPIDALNATIVRAKAIKGVLTQRPGSIPTEALDLEIQAAEGVYQQLINSKGDSRVSKLNADDAKRATRSLASITGTLANTQTLNDISDRIFALECCNGILEKKACANLSETLTSRIEKCRSSKKN